MVLVFEKLNYGIEDGHSEREPRLKIRPDAVHDFLAMAHYSQHRQDGLHEDTIFPLPSLTQFEVGRIALRGMEGGITQDDHAAVKRPDQPLKRVVSDIRGGTVPPYHEAILIQQQTEFAPDNPTMVGQTLPADLLGAAPHLRVLTPYGPSHPRLPHATCC